MEGWLVTEAAVHRIHNDEQAELENGIGVDADVGRGKLQGSGCSAIAPAGAAAGSQSSGRKADTEAIQLHWVSLGGREDKSQRRCRHQASPGGIGASQKSRVGQGWRLLLSSPNDSAKADSAE
ncbi:hypothetical protein PG994_008027 [Apiospora phragmitis]|uniref:Uncharacterized protein n=1 Tax=Apiospora phragmitis TaxID=2905665 RepID=A0ABR1URV4_9PEZI